MIKFSVDGIPQPRQSVRSRVVKTKSGKSFAQHYQPADDRASSWIGLVHMAAQLNKPPAPLEGPLRMDVIIRRPRPKGKNKRYKGWPMSRPDRDNYIKPINDILEGIMYNNDSQICDGFIRKVYADVPGVDIEITELEEYNEQEK